MTPNNITATLKKTTSKTTREDHVASKNLDRCKNNSGRQKRNNEVTQKVTMDEDNCRDIQE